MIAHHMVAAAVISGTITVVAATSPSRLHELNKAGGFGRPQRFQLEGACACSIRRRRLAHLQHTASSAEPALTRLILASRHHGETFGSAPKARSES
jgi:hypothetical protein